MGGGGSKKKKEDEKNKKQLKQEEEVFEKQEEEDDEEEEEDKENQEDDDQQEEQEQQGQQQTKNVEEQQLGNSQKIKEKVRAFNLKQDENEEEIAQQQNQKIQKRNNDLTLDLSRDMPIMKGQDLTFNDDDLSPIDDNKETEEQKKKKILMKISQVIGVLNSTEKQRRFAWPNQGNCKLLTTTFSFKYNLDEKRLSFIKTYDQYTTSTLIWKKDANLKVFDFILQDDEIYNGIQDELIKLPNNIVKFLVSLDGSFIGIKEEQEYLQKIKIIDKEIKNEEGKIKKKKNGSNKKKQKKKKKKDYNKLIKASEEQIKNIWNNIVTQWIDQNELEKQELITGETIQNGNKCLIANKIDSRDNKRMAEFLEEQLVNNPQFFQRCFQSKQTIKDQLKLWKIVDQSQDQSTLNFKKFKFPVLENYEIIDAVVEETTQKPQVIVTNQCKKIVIEHKRDLFVDVFQELRLFVFLWPEILEGQNQSFFLTELSKFKDLSDLALKSCVLDLSRVKNLPLAFRAKVKEQYFSIH